MFRYLIKSSLGTEDEECIKVDHLINDFKDYFPKLATKTINLDNFVRKLDMNAEFVYALIDCNVIGFASFYANDMSSLNCHIVLLAVKREYQGLGVGRELIQNAITQARSKKMKTITLDVGKKNQRAISIYNHLGFKLAKEDEYSLSLILNLIPGENT